MVCYLHAVKSFNPPLTRPNYLNTVWKMSKPRIRTIFVWIQFWLFERPHYIALSCAIFVAVDWMWWKQQKHLKTQHHSQKLAYKGHWPVVIRLFQRYKFAFALTACVTDVRPISWSWAKIVKMFVETFTKLLLCPFFGKNSICRGATD